MSRAGLLSLCLLVGGSSLLASEAGAPASGELASGIPARPADAPSGSEFYRQIRHLKGRARDEAIRRELGRGNLPAFLRDLKPVRLAALDRGGRRHEAVIWVAPDYLAVGSDEDFVRVPMGLDAAVAVARDFGFTLPTRKMVDAIHRQSALRLAPRPMPPGPEMTSTRYFWDHNALIERQLGGHPLRDLISGHKKDLILTKRLLRRSGRVAIYGWHRRSGRPIQPLSTVHGARYADYSHGVRLVSTMVTLDGELRSVFDVLRDPELAPVLSYEGSIRDAARLMGRGPRPAAQRGRSPAAP